MIARIRPAWVLAIGLTLVVFTSCRSVPDQASVNATPPAEALLQARRPLVIAHRGYSALAPENTLAAFERAATAGADLTELDYHHSQDGRLVVIHDSTLDRTTDATNRWGGARLKVADYSFAQLGELDAGAWFGPSFAGQRLPELGQAIEVIQRHGVTLIERKAGDAAACAALIRERGLLNQVVVQAFDWDYLRTYHSLEPEQILAALGPPGTRNGRKLTDQEKRLNASWCDEIQALGARVVAWNRELDRDAVEAAHRRGLKVWVYTINDDELAQQLLDFGVDGIITDQPTLLRRVLADRGDTR